MKLVRKVDQPEDRLGKLYASHYRNENSLTFKQEGCVVTYVGQVNEAGQAHGIGAAQWERKGRTYHYRGSFVNNFFEGIG